MSLLNLLEKFIMFEKIRKMKNKKGFTLVELIVVLVILAILAALLVPALTGYIDKANYEKVVATTRSVVMAAQTEYSEAYGKGTAVALAATDEAKTTDIGKAACKLAEITDSANEYINDIKSVKLTGTATDGVITKVEVTQGKYSCVYEKNGLTDADSYDYTSGNYGVKAAS